ncbi:MAG: SUMF1/EgtB/PvdO family nonheme iron enzyme [Myxococcota bacterium]
MTSVWTPGAGNGSGPPANPGGDPATGEHVESLLTTGLDRYELKRLLGVGGMGEVYQGLHRTIEKDVAVKVLAYQHRHNPSLNNRFLEEAKAASKIRHDNVVDITDFGHSPQGCAYFVMEYLEGEDLAATLKREKPLAWPRVQHILSQLLSALGAAHERGIVHRDIKPANCLRFTKNNDPDFIKVLDFGIARISSPEQEEGERLTKAGTIMGTAEYMAPEQARAAADVDARTDLYAVGVMLFEMVTGQLPFTSGSPMELLAKHLTAPPPRASSVATYPLPVGLDELIARSLAKEPDERYATAQELSAAIAAISTDQVVSSPPQAGAPSQPGYTPAPVTANLPPNTGVDEPAAAPSQGSSKTGVAVAATLAGLALVGGGVWFATKGPTEDPKPAAASASNTEPAAAAAETPKAPPAPVPTVPTCTDGMVLVDAGSFFMGTDDPDNRALQTARPPHKVRLDAYCIAIDEVTTAQFQQCSAKGECQRAFKDSLWPQGTLEEKDWVQRREALSQLCNTEKDDRGEHPINCVTWAQARDYCEFAGGRLPTEAEWEFAARGSDGRIFPWGDEPPTHEHGNLCNAECKEWRRQQKLPPEGTLSDADDKWYGTAPVGTFPQGTTQHGLRDIVGNVFEWTASDFELYEDHPEGVTAKEGKVIRGGAFNSAYAMFANPALRFPSDPKAHNHGIGFRCAANPALVPADEAPKK